ncbi:hypothetical protein N9C62_00220 [Luminiphilus sp.]|nr:hypothetical protein [Luminiphilus sp.]
MDKATYFQSVYEAQFALGKKIGAAVSAQILALEAFIQCSARWHFRWWPIVGITPNAWSTLQHRAMEKSSVSTVNNRGLIRAHRYNREARSRLLFEREAPLPDAWHIYESRDTAILALTEEREKINDSGWLALDPNILGQQSSAVPTITRKRFAAMQLALRREAA